MTPVITTENLTRKFGETIAVNRLTLEIYRGEVFGLLGHNGAGKTTTVRLLNGVLNPTSGTARVLGLSPVEDGSKLRSKTGVLTETPSLYEQLSAHENLRIYADLYNVPQSEVAGRIQEMLKLLNLSDRAAEKVGGYSKGMKQRLALARAFLHQPEILFLDEPTAGVDPVAAKQVNDLIVELSRRENKTILLATHNLHDAQNLCDRVAVIEQGTLIALGSPTELARNIRRAVEVQIEVDVNQLEQAANVLQPFKVNIVKDALHVSDMLHADIPDALAKMVQNGIRVYRVMPNEATLEDVYFALQKKETP